MVPEMVERPKDEGDILGMLSFISLQSVPQTQEHLSHNSPIRQAN